MLCSNDALATYTISDLALEYDAIIDAGYTEKVSVAQGQSSYPYTRVTRLILPDTWKKGQLLVNRYKAAGKELTRVALAVSRGSDRFCIQGGKFLQP